MSVSSLGSNSSALSSLTSSLTTSSLSISVSVSSLGSSEIALLLGQANGLPQDTFESGTDNTPSGVSPLEARTSQQASDLLGNLSRSSSLYATTSASDPASTETFAQKLQDIISDLNKSLAAGAAPSSSSVGTTTSDSASNAAVEAFLGDLVALGSQFLAQAQPQGQTGADTGENDGAESEAAAAQAPVGGGGAHHVHGGGGGGSFVSAVESTDTNSVTASISLSLSSITTALDLFASSLVSALSTSISATGSDDFLQTLRTLGQSVAQESRENQPLYQQQDRLWQTYAPYNGVEAGGETAT